jgi:hypothetical protein
MIDEAMARSLQEALFADPKANVYAVLDGASANGLVMKLHEEEPPHFCLIPGELEPDMAEVAPYLVKLEQSAKFTAWVVKEGWGNHWGVFATAPADIRAMRGHFRSLFNIYDPEGKPMLFRFYDPRVLRVFLPTCGAQELAETFGPVTSYGLEAEDAKVMLRLQNEAGKLRKQEVSLVKAGSSARK